MEASATQEPRPFPTTVISWLVILVVAGGAMWSNNAFEPFFPSDPATKGSEKFHLQLEPGPQIQMMLRVGNTQNPAELASDSMMGLFGTSEAIQKFSDAQGPGNELPAAAAMAQWGDPKGALKLVDQLDEEVAAGTVELQPGDQELIADVRTALEASAAPSPGALSPEAQERLASRMDLAGRTLVQQATGDQALGDALRAEAMPVLMWMILFGVGAVGLGLAGAVLLIVFVVCAFMGKLRGAGPSSGNYSPILAEMFALWMLLFFGAKPVMGKVVVSVQKAVGDSVDETTLMLVFGLAGSLVAFAACIMWGKARGMSWDQIRTATGMRRASPMDMPAGLGSWAMAVPLLVVGVMVTFMLMMLMKAVGADMETVQPSHPVQGILKQGGVLDIALTYFLAAVMAPITEEFLFRGVLYRHLRDSFAWLPVVASVTASILISSTLFGAIHPQGIVFIPILGALAVSFCLMREWTGSIYPGMWAHAMNNGVIITLNLLLMG